jgi:protein O-mannosyl-transferase
LPATVKTTEVRYSAAFISAEKRKTIYCLLLAVVTLALYNPAMRASFVNYDDDRYVLENPRIHEGLSWDTVRWAFTSTEQANWFPLTWLSHALDWTLFRSNPTGHHLTSVLLHVMNVILFFVLLLRATGRAGPSLFAAALFAVHPINVESVAWIAERKNVLCTFFFLLALMAYEWYARKPQWKRYLAVCLLFAAGLASKPMVITLPFVLLLWDYWPLARVRPGEKQSEGPGEASGEELSEGRNIDHPGRSWSALVFEKIPLFALSFASALITMQVQQSGGATRSIAQYPFGVRIENAVWAYAMYLWKAIWPANLAALYPHPGDSLPAWQIFVSAGVLIAITILVFRLRTRKYLLVGWLWFLGTLVPVIGLVQVGEAAMADRYAYVPLMGIFMMVAFGANDFVAAKKVNVFAALVPAFVILIGLSVIAHRQIGYWQNSYELWTHALEVTKNNFVAEDNLGGALLREGKPDVAFTHFEAAAQINPRDPMSHNNLGVYFQTHGRLNDAIAQYQSVIALTSDAGLLAQTYANLGAAERTLGEDAAARENFNRAIGLDPDQSTAWLGLGLLEQKQGNLQDTIRDLSRAAQLHPSAESLLYLGRALEQAQRPSDAVAAYEQALKLDPEMKEAQQAWDSLRGSH